MLAEQLSKRPTVANVGFNILKTNKVTGIFGVFTWRSRANTLSGKFMIHARALQKELYMYFVREPTEYSRSQQKFPTQPLIIAPLTPRII